MQQFTKQTGTPKCMRQSLAHSILDSVTLLSISKPQHEHHNSNRQQKKPAVAKRQQKQASSCNKTAKKPANLHHKANK